MEIKARDGIKIQHPPCRGVIFLATGQSIDGGPGVRLAPK
jgi:hypothetical protein